MRTGSANRHSVGVIIKTPQECTRNDLETFIRLAHEGGQVKEQGLPARVKRARVLAFLVENGDTIGIAALKQPYKSYRTAVFARAKATLMSNSFPFEVGWVVISQKHQGRKLSRSVVEAVLTKARGQNVFATSAISREAMHRTLRRFGFVQHGQSYPPSQGDEDLFLFIHIAARRSAAMTRRMPSAPER